MQNAHHQQSCANHLDHDRPTRLSNIHGRYSYAPQYRLSTRVFSTGTSMKLPVSLSFVGQFHCFFYTLLKAVGLSLCSRRMIRRIRSAATRERGGIMYLYAETI
jgi:hypothetical protein